MAKRALISVSDKTGVVEFAQGLVSNGFEIISTGGTAKVLSEAGIPIIGISEITGFPECLDGRVKTLHPNIHAGILAMRGDAEHMRQIAELGVSTIDVVAINLYPFKETISKPNVAFEEAIENIDIGGPTAIRAAAKNWQDVAVVVDPADYAPLIEELPNVSLQMKKRLSAKVFQHTAAYDALIAEYLWKQGIAGPRNDGGGGEFPSMITKTYALAQTMRYGENPHQSAAFYTDPLSVSGSIAAAEQLQGKELSFNNINDANAALELVKEFDAPAVVAVKHANPCGVAIADHALDAYNKVYNADPVSIFGGIVAVNREVTVELAKRLNEIFLEIVIAPSYEAAALEVFKEKPNLRVLTVDTSIKSAKYDDIKRVNGGILVQDVDAEDLVEMKAVTKRTPTSQEAADMRFGWTVCKYVKSNGIVLVKDGVTVGIGPGQTNRVTALQIAVNYARRRSSLDASGASSAAETQDAAKGAVLASDAFFPFDDCVKLANEAGVTAIIQPGGSMRDEDSIKACDEAGIAMSFTGMRHFRH